MSQLQNLPLGNGIGCMRHDFHDTDLTDLDHHLKRPGVEEVSNQNCGFVAKISVCGFYPPPGVRFIDNIVVQ